MSAALGEFDLIRRYFRNIHGHADALQLDLGVGDDCALISPNSGQQLAVSVDTLIEGRHFPEAAPAAELAWRALSVNVSDLNACGAEPLAFTLALTLPEADEPWLAEFAAGLAEAAAHFGIDLIGGDTCRGPLSLCLQVMGQLPSGKALLRSGARAGDEVWVSGTLGGARAALDVFDASVEDVGGEFLRAFYRPAPPLMLGPALRGIASAAIDISDGLLADLGHIATASGIGIALEAERLPLTQAMLDCFGAEKARQYAATGGDDYQLAITVPRARGAEMSAIATACGINLSQIGQCIEGEGVHCHNLSTDQTGWSHF